MDHELLTALEALADPNRLRVAGACATAARTVAQLAIALDLPEPAVRRHLDRLEAAGLVFEQPTARAADPGLAAADPGLAGDGLAGDGSAADVSYALRVSSIHAIGRGLAALRAAETGATADPEAAAEARIIRGFLRDGRLVTIPSQEKRRRIVVRYLCDQCFVEDRDYPEKEVNQRIALFHPDVATLRRAMVDDGLVTRTAGIYRRAR